MGYSLWGHKELDATERLTKGEERKIGSVLGEHLS